MLGADGRRTRADVRSGDWLGVSEHQSRDRNAAREIDIHRFHGSRDDLFLKRQVPLLANVQQGGTRISTAQSEGAILVGLCVRHSESATAASVFAHPPLVRHEHDLSVRNWISGVVANAA